MRTKRLIALGGLSAITLTAGLARAQAPGIELGLRLGYGVPLGGAAPGSDLDQNIAGEIPVWGELGYRIDPHWMAGAYGLYGFGFLTHDEQRVCDAYQVSCSVSDLRLGAQLHYHFMPARKLDPWLGLGFGYEWLIANADISSNERSGSASLRGWEFINLQGGLDWALGEGVALGPFLSVSVAQYTTVSVECTGPACRSSVSETLDDKALHSWVVVGLRGAFLCPTRGRGAPCPFR